VTRYADDSKDRVRDAVDMLALVSARTELRRAGVNSYFGRCPFHDERTGSFHVSPDDKLYHCFGCQASGDPFRFVMETEGLDFVGALEALADRFGVQLETVGEDPEAGARRARRERLHALLGRAAGYYARVLWEADEAAPARSYLLGRGLSEETLRRFRVGYAPSAWDRMLTASRRAGFTEEELLAAGLAQRSKTNPGQVFDRFRERIMFPSADARARVLGFGARAMRDNQRPKYLNTSDGELYHKRAQLFGIDQARAPAARAGRMILVEGYTDVLALHQAGVVNAVGIMGTALTEEQVAELERVVRVLELCLDADRAGQEAMMRASRLAEGRRLELRVVPLPEGQDPAELIEASGAEALRSLVERSVPFVVFNVERILDRADTRSAEGRDRALGELAPVLASLPASVLREDLLRRVAGRLELSEGRLASLVSASVASGASGASGALAGRGTLGGDGAAPRAVAPAVDQGVRAERTFLVMCVALPEVGERVLSGIDPDELLTSEPLRRAARHLVGRVASPLASLPSDDEELARVVADLVARAGRAGTVDPQHVEHARLVLERTRIDRAIRRARGQGGGDVGELARARELVLEGIRQVVAQMERAV
jgi:DNA primase